MRIGEKMDLKTIIKRMDDLEERVQEYDRVFKTFNEKIADLDAKVTGLPSEYRELKDDISQLKKVVSGIGTVDKSLTQIRKDTNNKITALQAESKKQQEQQKKIQQSDIKNISAKVDRMDTKLKSELDKRINAYKAEDSHLLETVEKIEQSVNTKLKSDENVRREQEIQKKDIQSVRNRLEIIGDDLPQFRKQQAELAGKLSVLLDTIKPIEVQITELKASETQRKISQAAFLEQQETSQKQREIRFEEIQSKISEEIRKISPMLERITKKEKDLTQIGNGLDDMKVSYERRLKEVTELYQLFEMKYQKDWSVLKSEIEKNWSNFSLINEEKQSSFVNRIDELKTRILLVEDQANDIRDLLGVMSSEIQKGMINLTKMANTWKDAFDNIEGK